MYSIKRIKSIFIILLCSIILTSGTCVINTATAEPIAQQLNINVQEVNSTPLAIVAMPKNYLSKKVTFNAKFDKFTTLGLDYKPAYKSSDEYISFLVKRDDTSYDIPLSEMKLFLKREEAEKFIDLKVDDYIQIVGTVFSDALGDAWIDVEKLVLIKKAQ